MWQADRYSDDVASLSLIHKPCFYILALIWYTSLSYTEETISVTDPPWWKSRVFTTPPCTISHMCYMPIHLNTRYMICKWRYFITRICIFKMTLLVTHMHTYSNTNNICYFFQCKSKIKNFLYIWTHFVFSLSYSTLQATKSKHRIKNIFIHKNGLWWFIMFFHLKRSTWTANNSSHKFTSTRTPDFYLTRIYKLVTWQKCVDCNGSYVG